VFSLPKVGNCLDRGAKKEEKTNKTAVFLKTHWANEANRLLIICALKF
tara:strand:+ start:436 stop:579 length:144 start_codon:yes stop_codon:yes gene_type:complete